MRCNSRVLPFLVFLLGLHACSGGGANVATTGATSSLPIEGVKRVAINLPSAISQASTSSGIDIDAGGLADSPWIADADYDSGWTTTVTTNINTSKVSNPAPQSVYRSQRTAANLTYTIPGFTPNARYNVRLHFVESWFSSAGQRVFDVTINGVRVLSNFDIFQTAGGANIATVSSSTTNADTRGIVTIHLSATVNNASIAGIEISSSTGSSSPTPPPSNGSVTWPAAGWKPYVIGPLTVPVGANPSYDASSGSVVNTLWNGRSSDAGLLQVYSGSPPPSSQDWAADVLYFGHSSDPVYTVSCYDYGGACSAAGTRVHIPRGAYPAGASDHHIVIRDTTSGKDLLLWSAPVPSGYGGSYAVGWGAVINSDSNGLNAVGATASGISAMWSVRETDLVHNTINHAILISINGESSSGYVYPASGWDNNFFRSGYPKMGAHFWLDVAPSQLPASCPTVARSYLTALNKYGAYFADYADVSHVFGILAESDMSYTYDGGASVWGPLMSSLGLNAQGMSDFSMSNCGIDMQSHMHVLAPPSSAS